VKILRNLVDLRAGPEDLMVRGKFRGRKTELRGDIKTPDRFHHVHCIIIAQEKNVPNNTFPNIARHKI
jgi:hypothetical protein